MQTPADPKVLAAVADCLEQCKATPAPWRVAARFIKALKESSDWSDAEIIALQTRVIEELLRSMA